ncbi:hypothetical protein Ancab_036186 [Ancistrocladus abbreviatus]
MPNHLHRQLSIMRGSALPRDPAVESRSPPPRTFTFARLHPTATRSGATSSLSLSLSLAEDNIAILLSSSSPSSSPLAGGSILGL